MQSVVFLTRPDYACPLCSIVLTVSLVYILCSCSFRYWSLLRTVNYAFMLVHEPYEQTLISTTAALLTRNDKLALQNCQKALRARPYNPPVQVCQLTLADHVRRLSMLKLHYHFRYNRLYLPFL